MGTINITIPAGESLSDPVQLTAKQPLALIAPPEWDGGARLTFQMSVNGTDFYDVSHWSTDQVFAIPIVPSYWVPLDVQAFPNNSISLKIRSGVPARPVPQTADRTFIMITT